MGDGPTPCITEEMQFTIGGDDFANVPSPWGNFSVEGDDGAVWIVELERVMCGENKRRKQGRHRRDMSK